MSADHNRRQIQSAQSEIVRLQRNKGTEARKVADLSAKISNASQAANRSTSVSTVNSKLREVQRYERDKANAEKRIADIESRIAARFRHGTRDGKVTVIRAVKLTTTVTPPAYSRRWGLS